MKKQITIFLMFLSLALTMSCSKDYNALFQERVTQLNKEGKYILCQKNDSTGHYILYMDADKIVVDTLGDSPKEYPLGKLKIHEYKAALNEGSKFCMKSIDGPYYTFKADTAKKQMVVCVDGVEGRCGTTKFSDFNIHRDYLSFSTFDEDCKNIYLFLNDKLDVYVFDPFDIEEKEDGIHLSFVRPGTEFWGVVPANTPEELNTENWEYDAKLDVHGNIISESDHVTVYGTDIPTSAFGTLNINSYYQKIADEKNPYYYWNCQNCCKIMKSESQPKSGLCESNFFSGHWTFHRWVRLCKAGSAHVYQCQYCGVQVHTSEAPGMGACSSGSNHVWNQLQ